MAATFTSLTDAIPGLLQFSPVAFDLTGESKLQFVYASQKKHSAGSSRFESEAVVLALSYPGQPVAVIHDPHSLESADG
jgi:hypothetical protein